jgi:thymidylate kinase
MIEGPDGAGKSWVARTLVGGLAAHGGTNPERPCILQKLSRDSNPEDYLLQPLRWCRVGGFHVVQDRGVLSGPVYEPLFRRDMARLEWMNPLVEAAADAGALVIHVTADPKVLAPRVEERGDDYVTPGNLLDIWQSYEAVLQRWERAGGKMIEINTTHGFPSRTEVMLAASALIT